MEPLAAYIPIDRCQALAHGQALPDHTHGTALLADISGFTPLTESLLNALGPQRGAEEISRHLNAVYTAVIAEVDRYGGSVLAFSGDAITCWFDADPGRRAVTCALAMQTAMHPFAALTLSTGTPMALAMKVALAGGPACRLVVGDPAIQRLDVLAGATLDRMAAAEHHAQRGEVVADASTVEKLGSAVEVTREVTVGGKRYAALTRLRRPARQRPWPPLVEAQLTAATLRPWLLPPVYARLREGPAHFLAEIRPCVALFMKFGGIDYDADPQAAQKLDAYLCSVQQALRPYEAFVLQLTLGDKGCYLCAAFGAPLAHDDDPLRAVAAALDLHALGSRFEYIRDVRLGLNAGRVWCGAYGGRTRHTYGVLGDVVNVAARLMEQAAPGQTWLGPSLAEAAETHYALESVGELKLKGKAAPLRVFRVVCPLDARVFPAQPASQPLIGRQAELTWLDALWQAARGGAGRVACLTGAGGVGKSCLVQTFALAAANSGARVGMGLCHEVDQFVAYKPWRSILLRLLNVPECDWSSEQLVETVPAALGALDPAWQRRAPLLGDVLDLPIPDNPVTAAFDPRLRRETIWALVVDVVRAAASRQPLLLWLDNVHAMDEASGALTLAVGRALEHSPVLLLCTRRPLAPGAPDPFAEWASWPNYGELDLPLLADAEIAALVQNRLGGQVQLLALTLLQKQAQGNAFYAGELAVAMKGAGLLVQLADKVWYLSERLFRLLQDQHCLVRRAPDSPWMLAPEAVFSAETLGFPDSVQRTIAARLDQLAPEVQLTLKTASVIGPLFEVEILERAHPHYSRQETLAAHLAELKQRDLVRAVAHRLPPAYAFAHNLVQEGIYAGLLVEQQIELHASVGAALEEVRPEAVEQLAYHFSRAQNRDKAPLYLGRAGDKARRGYVNETALTYYEQALALAERWEWRKAQVEVLGILGQRPQQQAALEKLTAMPGAPAFEVAYLWGQYYESLSNYAQAQAQLERALELARAQPNPLQEASCLNQLGLIAYRQGDYDQAKGWFEQSQVLFALRAGCSPDEPRLLAQAANGVGLAHLQQGNYAETGPCFRQALALYRQAGDLRGEAQTLSNLGLAAYRQRKLQVAQDFHRQVLELRSAIGDRVGQGSSLNDLALVARDVGDYAQALASLLAALQIQQEVGHRWGEVNIWIDLGALYQELGDLGQAQECLQHGLAVSVAIGDEAGQAYVRHNLGLVLYDRGDFQSAAEIWQVGRTLAQKQEDKALEAWFLSYLGELGRQTGDFERAAEFARQAIDLRQTLGLETFVIDDLCTLALVRQALLDEPGAQACAQQAWEALQACRGEGPEFPQRDYWACYRVLATGGRQSEAQAALQAAYAWVMARAARIAEPKLRRSFLENAPRNRQVLEEAQRVLGVAPPAAEAAP